MKAIGPHRASEYVLHPPGTALGLLGVLLEGLSPRAQTFIRLHFEEVTDAGERQESNAKWERSEKDKWEKDKWEKDNGKRIAKKG